MGFNSGFKGLIIIIIIIIIIIGSAAMGGPWPPQANVASDLYPGHPPANFYNPVSLHQFFFKNRLVCNKSKLKLY